MTKPKRCTRCRKKLDEEEIYFYIETCNDCEDDMMAILNEMRGWRWWVRLVAYGARYVVGSMGMLADSWRRT